MIRAVVVGGSIGGLLVAKALVDHVDELVIIDRDTPPSEPIPRKGVPQGTQVHTLLDSGRAAMDALLPGLFDDLLEADGVEVDVGVGARWYHSGGYKVHAPIGVTNCVQSRPLLEHYIRGRVAATEGIELRWGVSCAGLEIEDGRVTGVHTTTPDGQAQTLPADIVILASGRGKHVINWLEQVGCPAPPVVSIPIGLGYASRLYEDFPAVTSETPLLLSYGVRGKTRRHGLAFRVEGNRTLVALMGYRGDLPPKSNDEWVAWADTLEVGDIASNLEHATPLGDVASFRIPEQFRRHWHRTQLPEGVAVFGDAACGLDPVFGQGMSVVATQAAALQQMLRRGPFRTKQVQQMVSRKANRAWLITSIEAARYPEIAPHVDVPMVGLLHRFLDRVFAASERDPVVYRAFIDVMFLNRSARWLMRPHILWRVLRPGREAPEPPPQSARVNEAA